MSFDPTLVRQRTADIAAALPALDWITDSRVERLSQDFYWFSPVLKRQLEHLRADAVVKPRTEDEIRAVVSACARAGVPLTARGSGTGNYGQCIPLHGGVVLDLSGYNQLLWARPGKARAQAGIRLLDLDRQLAQADEGSGRGWELRCVPSTYRTATLGGLFGGGFGGLGSITYGPLAAPGNVLGVRALSIETEPQVVELRGAQALALHHVYGTNGLVLELEVGLAPAHAWLEGVASFAGFDEALECAHALASATGIVKKGVTLLAAPITDILMQASPPLRGAAPDGAHTVFFVVADFSEEPTQALIEGFGGRITQRRTAEEVQRTNRTLTEYTWNHTTLNALRVDKRLTYLQTAFDPLRNLQQVRAMREHFGDEVMVHLEFIRTKEGVVNCSGLQLVRFTSEERLNEIMKIHAEHGVYLMNPHAWVVEDGKAGPINPAALPAKRRFDPAGLLNPGKLRSWAAPPTLQTSPP